MSRRSWPAASAALCLASRPMPWPPWRSWWKSSALRRRHFWSCQWLEHSWSTLPTPSLLPAWRMPCAEEERQEEVAADLRRASQIKLSHESTRMSANLLQNRGERESPTLVHAYADFRSQF